MTHVIAHMESIYGKVTLRELDTKTVDDIYGDAIGTTFKNDKDIDAVVIDEKGYYLNKLQQDWAIQLKSTPVLLVPRTRVIPLGSRVIDNRTNCLYEVLDLVDVAIHPYDAANVLVSYNEYKLRKIQEQDGIGI